MSKRLFLKSVVKRCVSDDFLQIVKYRILWSYFLPEPSKDFQWYWVDHSSSLLDARANKYSVPSKAGWLEVGLDYSEGRFYPQGDVELMHPKTLLCPFCGGAGKRWDNDCHIMSCGWCNATGNGETSRDNFRAADLQGTEYSKYFSD